MHASEQSYGKFAKAYLGVIRSIADDLKTTEILDYGCGKRMVKKHLEPVGFTIHEYDPAIVGLETPPEPCRYVVCVDVLEHIEPECFIAVLKDLKRVTLEMLFVTFATKPALKNLPDGTNPHKIVNPVEWWQDTLGEFFELAPILHARDGHYYVCATPRKGPVG